jgi:hypothetical protein
MAITGIRQHLSDLSDMRISTGFERNINHCIAQVHSIVRTVVRSLDNIRASVGDDSRQRMKGAGSIGEVNS